jgi:hypothetical protein
VHRELKRKHVTLLILWDEYIATNPSGYSYSRFCELYRFFEKALSVTMRQTHAAGERMFVDYAGDGVPVIIDRLTGEISRPASTSLRSIVPTARWWPIMELPSCQRGRESRATRRVLHTAPCSDPDGTTGANRGGCGPRPPWPLRMVWSSGIRQRPRFRLSV